MKDAKILIIATHGFEQSELEVPRDRLREAGATVKVASPDGRPIRGWKDKDWGREVPADLTIAAAELASFDALVIPGGQINPDLLRVDAEAMAAVRHFAESGKVIAAICHGPWLLVEADLLRGRRATSYKSIRRDLENAGALWQDQPVVADQGLITSRSPADLEPFVAKIQEEVKEGRHRGRRAA